MTDSKSQPPPVGPPIGCFQLDGHDVPFAAGQTILQALFVTSCDWKVSELGWIYTLFFVLLGKKLWGAISGALDGRAAGIRRRSLGFVGVPVLRRDQRLVGFDRQEAPHTIGRCEQQSDDHQRPGQPRRGQACGSRGSPHPPHGCPQASDGSQRTPGGCP